MERRKFILTSAIAAVATLPITALAKATKEIATERSKGFIVKSKESRFEEKTIMGSSPNDIKVSTKDTNGDLTIFEYTGNDKGGPPLHVHYKQDEIFYILEGDYIFQLGDEKVNAKSGDTIFIPRKTPHTFAQISDKGKMFYLFQPSGRMEELFRKTNDAKNPLTQEEMGKLAIECDSKALGPPLEF